MIVCLGDLVDDVIVRLDDAVNVASDTGARISHRRGGSAANVAAAAAGLGASSRFIGQVGDDAVGDALLGELRSAGVDVSFATRSGVTGSVVALVDRAGERTMLTDRASCTDLDHPRPEWLDGAGVLHVPFYSLAGGPIAGTAATVIGWARERGIPVSIDVSSTSVLAEFGLDAVERCLAGSSPDVVFANAAEAELLQIDGPYVGALTVVKRGADPATVFVPDGSRTEVAAESVEGSADTTGAGDAFAAGFLATPGWLHDPITACAAGHSSAAALLASR